MPTTVHLTRMSAKFLVDLVSHSGWSTKGVEDVYRGGQLLAELLPAYIPAPVDTDTPDPKAGMATIKESELAGHEEIVLLEPPVPGAITDKGDVDWSRMDRTEAESFRRKVKEHNKAWTTWCRVPIKPITLTDKQFETCQRVLKFYAPRPDEDKQKDREKQVPLRPELPNNEHTFVLLREFKLSAE